MRGSGDDHGFTTRVAPALRSRHTEHRHRNDSACTYCCASPLQRGWAGRFPGEPAAASVAWPPGRRCAAAWVLTSIIRMHRGAADHRCGAATPSPRHHRGDGAVKCVGRPAALPRRAGGRSIQHRNIAIRRPSERRAVLGGARGERGGGAALQPRTRWARGPALRPARAPRSPAAAPPPQVRAPAPQPPPFPAAQPLTTAQQRSC